VRGKKKESNRFPYGFKKQFAVFDIGSIIPRIHPKPCAALVILSEAGVE
jgi:hypothetical protein